ncbi:MAG: hypothetical protein P8Z80_00120 [Pseudolabrys sp.]|jgi:uncharacterized membrane protein
MDALHWLIVVALGAAMGLLGQGMRVVVGLKKANDKAAANHKTLSESFVASTLLLSLLIGAIAGALAAVATSSKLTGMIQAPSLLALAAAGYSGADFLEGFMSKYLPKS